MKLSNPTLFKKIAALVCLLVPSVIVSAQAVLLPNPAANDVVWSSLGTNENDSMPLGNGDLAANVWTEQDGKLVLLLAKADAWTEMGKLVKLGRVTMQLTPNPFTGATNFSQTLKLEDGSIEIKAGDNRVLVWIDANHPALHMETHLEQAATLQTHLELWRTAHPLRGASADKGGMFESASDSMPVDFEADTILPAENNRVAWCHFNTNSIFPTVLRQEHLESLIAKYPDPLMGRCFGAVLSGAGLVSSDDHTLQSKQPAQNFRVDLVALTEKDVTSAEQWSADIDKVAKKANPSNLHRAWEAHQQWWQDFWSRSWVQVGGDDAARKVSQGYAMQRFMIAASSRGEIPTKFNGGLFTVGHDIPVDMNSSDTNHNADYRRWGNAYWNQNNRLLYWPLVATGDYDLLKPWFGMYTNDLPLARDRVQIYFHHGGASMPETMYFWGLSDLRDFGWNNPGYDLKSEWQRYHIQGTLEVISQMLDYYDNTGDTTFAKNALLPFADAIVTFYDQHYQRDANGKIRMSPAQSLETYQLVAVNPTPDVAGLRSVIPRLLALPEDLTTAEERTNWAGTFKDLPAIPTGKTTARGKIPPLGKGDDTGLATLLPAESYGTTHNSENPELYTAFPYRIYGVGKPDLQLVKNAFAARRSPQNTCWGQDGPQAAVIGLTPVAEKAAVSEFTNYGNERFPWFWKAAHDWIPDLDNGGTGMITLQYMLMQCDGKRIQLLPAWPENWTADFKLHAPYETTVEGHVENGKLTQLKVTPKTREADVVVVK